MSHGSEAYAAQERAALAAARADPIVRAEVVGDLILYNQVVLPLFERQLRSHRTAREQKLAGVLGARYSQGATDRAAVLQVT